jgi:hypothetical protein
VLLNAAGAWNGDAVVIKIGAISGFFLQLYLLYFSVAYAKHITKTGEFRADFSDLRRAESYSFMSPAH